MIKLDLNQLFIRIELGLGKGNLTKTKTVLNYVWM